MTERVIVVLALIVTIIVGFGASEMFIQFFERQLCSKPYARGR